VAGDVRARRWILRSLVGVIACEASWRRGCLWMPVLNDEIATPNPDECLERSGKSWGFIGMKGDICLYLQQRSRID